MVTVAIVGATGYAGLEALRLLAGHPGAEVTYLASHSQAGRTIGSVHPHLGPLAGLPLLPPDPEAIAGAAQVALLSLPARQSLELAPELLRRGVRVIDFGGDFRLQDDEAYARHYGGAHTATDWLRRAVYGLTEFHRAAICGAELVANPGCYPTAALLALRPAVAAGLVDTDDLVVDAKSGVSGAGRQATQQTHYPDADGNVWPYKLVGEHRHTPEIEQDLALAAGGPVVVTFSPHQVPMSRGLLATCYGRLRGPLDRDELLARYREAYAGEPFVEVLSDGLPATKSTLGTNRAQVAVRLDPRARRLVAVCAIDNLGKGAAGQAVQNLNCMFGLPEAQGLPLIGLVP